MRVVLATHNHHKVDEVRQIAPDIEWVTLADLGFTEDPPETGATFAANALQKARFVYERAGATALADDSGLEVDGLGGAPGVHSKRFSPEETAEANNALLLARLTPGLDRTARFRCALAVVGPGGEGVVEGACPGAIATAPRGANGFGYDPLFLPDESPGRTMAELSPAEKHAISHRGRAFAQLAALLSRVGS
ncbi:MAG: RdgB/HAM1 family non-canonical purine NTP pyrophosphatase [Myxococcota bacterium]